MTKAKHKTDWFWVFYGFLFYVVFHFGVLVAIALLTKSSGSLTRISYVLFTVGFLLVGGFIGYHSRGVTVREPGISAGLYVIALFLFFASRRGTANLTDSFFLEFASLLVLGLLFGFLGGLWGEKLQEWKQKKNVPT
jgi:hypothetical protein